MPMLRDLAALSFVLLCCVLVVATAILALKIFLRVRGKPAAASDAGKVYGPLDHFYFAAILAVVIVVTEISFDFVWWAPIVAYPVLMVANTMYILQIKSPAEHARHGSWRGLLFDFVRALVAVLVMFGFLCRSVEAAFPGQFADVGRDRMAWIYFGMDNLAEAILLDIPSIYDLHWSPTRPQSFAARTMVLVYRLIVDLCVLGTAWHFIEVFVLPNLPRKQTGEASAVDPTTRTS